MIPLNDFLDGQSSEFRLALQKFLEDVLGERSIIGAILVGSRPRFQADHSTDVDIEIVKDDALPQSSIESERHSSRTIDSFEFEVATLFLRELNLKSRSPRDIDHWPYEECVLLKDQNDILKKTCEKIVLIDDTLRKQRVMLHYWETLFCLRRISSLQIKRQFESLNITVHQGVQCLIKALFLCQNRWPPVPHWMWSSLSRLESLPEHILEILRALVLQPESVDRNAIISELDDYFLQYGCDFVRQKAHLTSRILSDDFRPVREQYGGW